MPMRAGHRVVSHVIHRRPKARGLLPLLALALVGVPLGAQAVPAGADSDSGVVMGTVRSWRRDRTVARAKVLLEPVPDSGTSAPIAAWTDSLGHYLVRAKAGPYLLLSRTMDAEANGIARVTVRVRAGDTARVDLFIPPYGFDPARRAAQLDELARNYARWQQRAPVAYRATLGWGCFCLGVGVGDWRLEVRPETTVVLRRPKYAGDRPPVASVEALFEWLETEIRDPGQRVEVRYDSRLGFPTYIDTDTVNYLTDMWTRVEVRALAAVRGAAPNR